MTKLLRSIRFDASDSHVFPKAAGPDEWAISGAFAFAGLEERPRGKARQAFVNGFLSLESFGWVTFVTVADCPASERAAVLERLATHLVRHYGAPGLAAALPAAEAEIAYAEDLCRDAPINRLFAVRRRFDEAGQLHEAFQVVQPPGETPHAKVWEILDDA